jgi:hypothetical protein
MENKYLKPMLDTGSPRVFNCNEMTRKIMARNPEAAPFFRSKPLNTIVLIKDAVPESERTKFSPSVGTKLFFPFNEANIYEGGRTIFLHDKHVQKAIQNHFGDGALSQESLAEDMRILKILDKLPSLDPFLLKDVFLGHKIVVNEDYFEVSQETWNEIELFMLQRFETLVQAAFPNAESSDDKARVLIEKMWEARDIEALRPLIEAFRLPMNEALDIFAAWKGIVYYSFQYQRDQVKMTDLLKWLVLNNVPVVGVPTPELKELLGQIEFSIGRIKTEWKMVDDIVRDYQNSYDKMFRYKTSSSEFLTFLKQSNKIYWEIGNSLGKINHAVYCWDVMTSRFNERKLPWANLQEVVRLLAKVFEPEKKTATSVAWS